MRVTCSVFLLATVIFLGCGGSDANRLPTHLASGTVKMGGEPVADASVTFSPQDGQPVAFGRTMSDGRFVLTTYEAGDGAVAGNYKVLISKPGGAPDAGQSSDAVHSAMSSGGASPTAHSAPRGAGGTGTSLPPQYADATKSPITKTVEEGKENVFDIVLEP